jgi:energy-coupling factor transport system permease protein
MTAACLHPLTRAGLFLAVGLYAALCERVPVQAALAGVLLAIVVACGAIKPYWRLLVWGHLMGLPAVAILFLLTGYERSGLWADAVPWSLIEVAKYALRLECLLLANVAMIGTISLREMTELLTHRWMPAWLGVPLLAAVRFMPLMLAESHRIYNVQRCRGLRLHPWSPRTWLPVFIPLFIAQMQRAHDTALALVVRRMTPGTQAGSPRRLRPLDYVVLSLAAALCAGAWW